MEKKKKPAIRFKGFTDSWEQRKLGDIATDMIAGGDVDKDLILDEGRYPVIANALTNDGIVGYYNNEYRIKAPAVTITGRGDVGHAKARNVDFTPVVRLLSLKSNHDVFFLENAINTLKIVIESTGVPQLTVPQLAKYEVTFPKTLNEEEKIGQYFANLDHLITLHQRKYDKLQIIKKAMLEKMFPQNGSCFPEIRFKGFTDSWEQRKLIEVCDYVDYRGKTPTKVNNGIFLVTAKNVKDGYIDYESSKEYISEDDYEEVMRRGKPEIGDVLITTEAPCGNIAQVNTSNIALAQRIIKYRGHKNVIDNTYLKHYMLAPHFQKILFEKSSGGTVQGIKGSILHQQDVIYPMYDEQVKMGVYFDALDNLITLHQREVEKLQNIKKSMLETMFV